MLVNLTSVCYGYLSWVKLDDDYNYPHSYTEYTVSEMFGDKCHGNSLKFKDNILIQFNMYMCGFKHGLCIDYTNVYRNIGEDKYKSICEYKYGKKHGKEHNYTHGVLTNRSEYKFDVFHGVNYNYYNGKIEYKKTYKYGVPHGPQYRYHKNGNIYHEYTYINGKLDGFYRVFNKKGKIMEERLYSCDCIISRFCYRNGRLILRKYEDGTQERYDKNGNIKAKGMVDIRGLQYGEWTYKNYTTIHGRTY